MCAVIRQEYGEALLLSRSRLEYGGQTAKVGQPIPLERLILGADKGDIAHVGRRPLVGRELMPQVLDSLPVIPDEGHGFAEVLAHNGRTHA